MVANFDQFEWKGEGSFGAWLFCIARNLVTDFYRYNGRRTEPLSLDELSDIQADIVPPEMLVLRKETLVHLYHLITELSPRRQEVIVLHFFGGLRNREIAEVLGLDERTVAAHLSRGLADLYQKYEEFQNEGSSRTTI